MAEITNETIIALIDEKITNVTLNALAKKYLNSGTTMAVNEFFTLLSSVIQGDNSAVYAATVNAMDDEESLVLLDTLNNQLLAQAQESAQFADDLKTFGKMLMTIAAAKYGVVL